MGVALTDLVEAEEIEFEALMKKRVAIDAMNALYQFLAIIRQPTGEPLMDSKGRITSHLSGLFYRTVNLLEYGLQPIYVFDGKPPELKLRVVEERKKTREEAAKKWKKALEEGKLDEARLYAQQASRITDEMIEQAKKLLDYMGIPYVQAPSEGEAQAAYIAMKGDAYATGSQDYDSLLFGSPRLVRNLTISGRRKLPRKDVYVEIKPEIIVLEKFLKKLNITREQLVDIAILIGTDYNPGGVEGVGPKRAYELIRKHKSIDNLVKRGVIKIDFDYERIRELFLNPEVTDNYRIEFREPDKDRIIEFMCGEHDFSEERIKKALEKIIKAREAKKQASLDAWFK